MNTLLRAGFFREFPHGDPEGPSINESVNVDPQTYQSEIVRYLDRGVLFVATPGAVTDYFKPEQIVGSPHILTDGVWVWPADFVYYVKHYNVEVPTDMIIHMRNRGWEPPRADSIDLSSLSF